MSRIVKYLGVKWAVMILPCISLGAYNVLAFIPTLTFVLTAKVAENSTDYSLNNTVRNMLFLPCTYEEKFSAKQAIDSFFVRMGDVLSAALVFFGTNIMQLEPAPVRGGQRRARARLAGARLACRQHLHAADDGATGGCVASAELPPEGGSHDLAAGHQPRIVWLPPLGGS